LITSRKSVEKIQVSLKSEIITSPLHENQYMFMITLRKIFFLNEKYFGQLYRKSKHVLCLITLTKMVQFMR